MGTQKSSRWSMRDIRRFWSSCASPYFGDIVAAYLVRVARRFIRPPVLDAGAGSGALIRLIPGATGIDLSPKRGSRVQKGDVTRLAFPAESFGTVFCSEVIEHLPVRAVPRALREIRRVLRPGGCAIMTVPFDEPLERETVHCPHCGRSFHRYGHQRRFRTGDLERLVRRAGLEVVQSRVLPLDAFGRHPRLRPLVWALHRFTRRYELSSRLLVIARRA